MTDRAYVADDPHGGGEARPPAPPPLHPPSHRPLRRPFGFGPLRFPHIEDPQCRDGLIVSVWEGMYATVHMVLTGGKFLVGYLFLLGAGPFHLGLVNAIPFLFQFFQLIAAYVTALVGSRRKIVIVTAGLARHLWLLAIVLPFVPWSPSTRITLFLIGFAFYNILIIMASNAWLMWMNDLLPPSVRGRYVAIRGAILLVVTICCDWLGSQVLDHFTLADRPELGFGLLFAVAGVMATLGTRCYIRQYEPPVMPEPVIPLRRVLKQIRRHGSFMNVIRFFFVWNLGLGISAAFFHPHMLSNLGLNYSGIWFYTMVVGVVGFFSSFFWGRVQDKVGTKPIMLLCALFICSFPSIWLFARPDRHWPLYVEAVLSGVFWVGFNTAAFNLPLITAPDKFRSYFVGIFSGAAGLSFAAASFLGGLIAEELSPMRVEWLGQTFVNYHVLFAISTLLRITALFYLKRVEETRARPMGFLLQEIGLGIQKSRYVARQFLQIPGRLLQENRSGRGGSQAGAAR